MRYETPGIAAISIAAALFASGPAAAQQKVKIGFITTLSGPQGVVGEYMKNSVELALDHLGRKVGGLEVEIIYGDDQVKPDVGKQLADEMLKKHKVHFVSGSIWSNVMLAVAPTVTGAGTFMIGTNAFFFNDTATTEIYTLSLHDALPTLRPWMYAAALTMRPWRGFRSRNVTPRRARQDRKSTRLNSSHMSISYAVFCLKKKKKQKNNSTSTKKKNKKINI